MNKKDNKTPQKKCVQCGKSYSKDKLISKKQWNNSKFCSKNCHYKWRIGKLNPHTRRKMTEEEKAERRKNPKAWAGFTKGRKLTEDHKKKLSIAKKKISKELAKKISATKQGVALKDWNGFITKESRLERLRFKREIQKLVLERDNYTCQICGQRGGKLQVDHIQSWAKYVELRFNINNCRTLCMDCHYLITFGKKKPKNVLSWGHNL